MNPNKWCPQALETAAPLLAVATTARVADPREGGEVRRVPAMWTLDSSMVGGGGAIASIAR
jgi:hypothetical protein